jgi:tRNA1Val (adenine37-N6)-methyltransferase
MSIFRFQQFSVIQEQSAMKVCTDTLLFGAMMPAAAGKTVLDIGTGSGVLALMAAQLGGERITGVELTQEAYREAKLNFSLSPWADRLQAVYRSIQEFAETADLQYDLIICNPPFFERHFPSRNKLRRTARHAEHLAFGELIDIVDKLLKPQGYCYLLLPIHAVSKLTELAKEAGLYPVRVTLVQGFAHSEARVAALTFDRSRSTCLKKRMTVYESAGVYTQESERYLSSFLLRFSGSHRGRVPGD